LNVIKTNLQRLSTPVARPTPRPTESSFTPAPRGGSTGTISRPVLPRDGGMTGSIGTGMTNLVANQASTSLSRLLHKVTGERTPFTGSPTQNLSSIGSKLSSAFQSNPDAFISKLQQNPRMASKLLHLADNLERVAPRLPTELGKVFTDTANTIRAMAYAPGPRLPMLPPIG
jgi:hypothetical protein